MGGAAPAVTSPMVLALVGLGPPEWDGQLLGRRVIARAATWEVKARVRRLWICDSGGGEQRWHKGLAWARDNLSLLGAPGPAIGRPPATDTDTLHTTSPADPFSLAPLPLHSLSHVVGWYCTARGHTLDCGTHMAGLDLTACLQPSPSPASARVCKASRT